MPLVSLALRNYRCFEDVRLDLDPQVTLLVGENGAGKSTLIQAAYHALRFVAAGFDGRLFEQHVEWHDIANAVRTQRTVVGSQISSEAQLPLVLDFTTSFHNRADTVSVRHDGTTRKDGLSALQQNLRARGAAVQRGEALSLPLLAHLGVERTPAPKSQSVFEVPASASRLDSLFDWMRPTTDVKALTSWLFMQSYSELQTSHRSPALACVGRALRAAMGVSEPIPDSEQILQFDGTEGSVVVRTDGAWVRLQDLSDGFRRIILFVTDLARRAFLLNPQYGADAAILTEGIVLVDEIDLHLHPRWQRRILGDLTTAFPRMQFLTTTHSPQVLAAAKREWVRLVSGGRVVPLVGHVEGRDSNAILEDILGVHARPVEWEERIRQVYTSIDEGDFERATHLLETELAPLGPDDLDVVRIRWQLHAAQTPLQGS